MNQLCATPKFTSSGGLDIIHYLYFTKEYYSRSLYQTFILQSQYSRSYSRPLLGATIVGSLFTQVLKKTFSLEKVKNGNCSEGRSKNTFFPKMYPQKSTFSLHV